MSIQFVKISSSGRGAVWLACLTGGQEVAGSSPVAPIFSIANEGVSFNLKKQYRLFSAFEKVNVGSVFFFCLVSELDLYDDSEII